MSEVVESDVDGVRTVLRSYEFTKVRVRLRRNADGGYAEEAAEMAAIRANPYYFGHDIYAPKSIEEGGPFTIGRVIHSNRHATLTGWFGGVAVYGSALTPEEMWKLATIGRPGKDPAVISLQAALMSSVR